MIERLAAYAELADKGGFLFAIAHASALIFNSVGKQSFLTPGVCTSLLGEGDAVALRDERNPWLYVNAGNLRESVKDLAVNQNVIKALREGTSRGQQIWNAFNAGCYG